MAFVVLKNSFPRLAIDLEVKGKAAAVASAQRIARAAASRAPVLTGELSASVRAVGSTITASAPYAGYVEHGTNDTRPQPFFFDALDADESNLVASLLAILRSHGG